MEGHENVIKGDNRIFKLRKKVMSLYFKTPVHFRRLCGKPLTFLGGVSAAAPSVKIAPGCWEPGDPLNWKGWLGLFGGLVLSGFMKEAGDEGIANENDGEGATDC